MSVALPLLALAAKVLEQLGERGIVGDDVERQAEVGDRRADDVVVADVPGGHDDPALGRLVADALERRRVERLHERDDLVLAA